jgi:hypothetical protein
MTRIDRRAFITAAGAAAAVLFAARAQEPGGGWAPRAGLPWPVQEIYGVEWAGMAVIAGGLVSRRGQPLHIEDRVGLYTPAADRWDEGPKLPAPRHHPMLIAGNDGRLYAFGGYGRSEAGEWTAMTDVWALDAGAWKAVTSLPERLCETVGGQPCRRAAPRYRPFAEGSGERRMERPRRCGDPPCLPPGR